MEPTQIPSNFLPIEEWQTVATEGWRHRYLRSSEIRFAFMILSLSVFCLSGMNGFSFGASTAVAAVVMCIGWCFSTLEPGREKNSRPRKIVFDGSSLEVRSSDSSVQFLLDASCWYVGKISDDRSYCDSRVDRCVPILVTPDNTTVAVGLDTNLQEAWERTFVHCRCPRVHRRKGMGSAAVSLLVGAALIAGIAAGYHLGGLIGDALFVARSVPANLVRALGVVMFGFGAYLTLWMSIPGWYRPIAAEDQALLRLAALFPVAVMLGRYRWVALPWPVAIVSAVVLALILLVLTAGAIKRKSQVLRSVRPPHAPS